MDTIEIPFSPACERNQEPIFNILKSYLSEGSLLEIGHGTGQHAVYLSQKFPQIVWTPTDVLENNWMLNRRIEGSKTLTNLNTAKALKVNRENTIRDQTDQSFDYVFTANTLHIMGLDEVTLFCDQISQVLTKDGILFIYGPFKFEGEHTSISNEQFDLTLRQRDPKSGIREFTFIKNKLEHQGLEWVQNHHMPANNFILVFKRTE